LEYDRPVGRPTAKRSVEDPVVDIESLALAKGQGVAERDAFAQRPRVTSDSLFRRLVAGIQVGHPLNQLAVGKVLDDHEAMGKTLLHTDIQAVVIRLAGVRVLLGDSGVLRKRKQQLLAGCRRCSAQRHGAWEQAEKWIRYGSSQRA